MSKFETGKDVDNIEEDINELKHIMTMRTDCGFAYSQKNTVSLQKSIENVLNDYTKQKQINEEQQKINGELREKVKKLDRENRKLKIVRIENAHGYENIHFITKNDLVNIDTNKYFIEIEEGTFVDLKQVYLNNKNSIPKQKIKDKIEELKRQRRELGFKTYLRKEDIINDDRVIVCQIQVLQELLQESEDK